MDALVQAAKTLKQRVRTLEEDKLKVEKELLVRHGAE